MDSIGNFEKTLITVKSLAENYWLYQISHVIKDYVKSSENIDIDI